MRDIFIFLAVLGPLPFVFKRPALGVMMFAWLSLMNPHRLAYAAAYDFPFASIVAIVTLAAMLLNKAPKRVPITVVTVVIMIFMVWITLTGFTAFEQERAWREWNRVEKTLFFSLVSIAVLNTEKDVKQFAAVVALSLGFYGLKGGLFTVTSGGSSLVLGPADTYISDNNDLALALLATVPLIWYLMLQATNRWLRWALMGTALLTIAAVVGSYSRGALLGGGAMLFLLWLKSENKLRTGLMVALLIPLVFLIMPEQWFGRMGSIGDYKADDSALGRINAWHFAFNVASANLMGGGFLTFTSKMFRVYAPDPYNVHAPHSIYFQVMGEHGFIGLLMFLVLLIFTWRTCSKIIKHSRENPELKWAQNLAAMLQVSLAGYAVGGAFLSLAYFDLLWDVFVITVVLEKVLLPKKAVPFWSKKPPPLERPALAVPARDPR